MNDAIEINLIEEKDFDNLKYHKLDWDVEVNHRPYQVISVESHAHCIGGKLDWGKGNCFWAYPLDEEMSYHNLIEFDGHPGATWGFTYEPTNYIKTKWDETSIERGRKLVITRNGSVFYDGFMTIHDCMAYVLDNKLDEHPLNLNMRDFDKKCIGRKIWYRSQPAVITSYIKGQACIMIAPDGIDHFKKPAEYENDDFLYYDEEELKVEIFSKWIYWFRRDNE